MQDSKGHQIYKLFYQKRMPAQGIINSHNPIPYFWCPDCRQVVKSIIKVVNPQWLTICPDCETQFIGDILTCPECGYEINPALIAKTTAKKKFFLENNYE